jgi:uncharacterized protein (DUF302 family)
VETPDGIVELLCTRPFDKTVERLQGLIDDKGLTLFALVDHAGEAAKAGLTMPPTKLVIFGSPKAGTPLMVLAPSLAIDLPLKILVREDAAGRVWVAYISPGWLQRRYELPQEMVSNIAGIEVLATAAAR